MRAPGKVFAATMGVAAAMAIVVVPASADPVNGSGKPVLPNSTDIVGVGSSIAQSVFDQFSLDYNRGVKTSAPHLYAWDATNPVTGKSHDLITAKASCPQAPRPSSSAEGIIGSVQDPLGLTANTRNEDNTFCTDFATSARGRQIQDPPAGPGGVQFVPFALTAVSYATNAVSKAPADLSTAQLAKIYTCAVTNWDQVGGKKAPIDAQLPPPGSLTRTSFLQALGGKHPVSPGRCVDHSKNEGTANAPAENEGVSKYLRGPDVIFPYSVASYLAQAYHSANCLKPSCTRVGGVSCKPRKSQNRFGCDRHGRLVLHLINKTRPARPFPLPSAARCQKACPRLNPKFSRAFLSNLFVVVRWTKGTTRNLPAYLKPLLGPGGWLCRSATARADLGDYGFAPLPQAKAGQIARKMTC